MSRIDSIECVIVGAGVVGLAIARSLAQRGHEVLILERETNFGTATSARNSEVVHAGIYYPTGSLKARAAVTGKNMLYEYCTSHGIAHARCGKLIVATSEAQVAQLDAIQAQAASNGVNDLQRLSAQQAIALEPALQCHAALLSPSTGIVDSHGFMLALLGDAEQAGATIACQARLQSVTRINNGFELDVDVDSSPFCLHARYLVNAAGHGACEVARMLRELPSSLHPTPVLAKGNYFRLCGKLPFERLVYPIPEPGGLGVHITRDMAGAARFGPDVEWIDAPDFSVDAERAKGFYSAIRQYWPGLPDDSLQPDYAGIRPKVKIGDKLCTDFVVQAPAQHGVPGWVNCLGIESPGLTSSLYLADIVAATLIPSDWQ